MGNQENQELDVTNKHLFQIFKADNPESVAHLSNTLRLHFQIQGSCFLHTSKRATDSDIDYYNFQNIQRQRYRIKNYTHKSKVGLQSRNEKFNQYQSSESGRYSKVRGQDKSTVCITRTEDVKVGSKVKVQTFSKLPGRNVKTKPGYRSSERKSRKELIFIKTKPHARSYYDTAGRDKNFCIQT